MAKRGSSGRSAQDAEGMRRFRFGNRRIPRHIPHDAPDGSFIWVYMLWTVYRHDAARSGAVLLRRRRYGAVESQRALEESARQTKRYPNGMRSSFTFCARCWFHGRLDFTKDVTEFTLLKQGVRAFVCLPEEEISDGRRRHRQVMTSGARIIQRCQTCWKPTDG
jgi:hypothetical protein